MRCPKCHFDNPETQRFCGECGTQLIPSEEIEVSPTKTLEAPKEELTTGSSFAGRYQIIEELGKGGMGNVYKVLDKEINARVALKLITPEISSDKKTIERFRNELKLTRDVSHKNVCRMYDLNKEEGTYFITMEYVSGEDLKSFIRRAGPLGVGKTIFIAKQVCEGLAEAHRLGVVHRDLKPQNIMIDKEGNARIMDFGIARSLKAKGITGTGMMIGTPEYMSPEQADAKEIDNRSDIYSLGAILYEMATGRVPFEGETPLSIAMKHKSEAPPNPKELNAQIPDNISRLILKCMEKNKERRYQSAQEVLSELTRIEEGIPSTERVVPKRKPITSKEITVTLGLKKLFIPALVVAAIAIIGVIIWQLIPQKQAVSPELPSIAVLPFADLSPQKDQEYLCDGMTDEIIAKLSRLKGWKVIPRTSVLRYKDTDKDIAVIGQELNIATVLEGSVRKEKDDIRVNTKLINVEDSSPLWSETYDQKLESVFDIQSDIAEKITKALKTKLSPEEQERLQKRPTENLVAYNLYLQGRFFWNKRTEEGLKKAMEYFEQAIEKDPAYALAYAGLADCYNTLGDWLVLRPKEAYPKAREAATKALEIDESLGEALNSLAWVNFLFDWDWLSAERGFRQAIRLNPSYATAHQWYAEYLAARGRFDEALTEIKQAQELDPLSLIISAVWGRILYFEREYDKSIEQYRKTLEMDPNFYPARLFLAWSYEQKGMYKEAFEELKKSTILAGDTVLIKTSLGRVYALAGRRDDALSILDELTKLSKQQYISPGMVAIIYATLGEKDQAFEWLEKAYEEHTYEIIEMGVDPAFDSLRSDPRFTALLKKVGFD